MCWVHGRSILKSYNIGTSLSTGYLFGATKTVQSLGPLPQ